jgi:hypothetical protein
VTRRERGAEVFIRATVVDCSGYLALISLPAGAAVDVHQMYAHPDKLITPDAADSQLSPEDYAELWRLIHAYGATRRDLVLASMSYSTDLPAAPGADEQAMTALSEFVSGLLLAWHDEHGGQPFCPQPRRPLHDS